MPGDWVKLHRKSLDSAVFKDKALWHCWSYLLLNANWTTRQLPDGRTLEPGQLVCGCRRLGSELGISKTEAGRKLSRLVKLGCIKLGTQSGTQANVITICNWTVYQDGDDAPRDASRDTTGTLAGRKRDASRDIKKKERKEEGKKGRKDIAIPPDPADVEAYCRERENGIDPSDFMDYYAARGWKYKNGQPMKDWQAAIRTWEKNKGKFDGKQKPLFASQHHDPDRPVEAL